MERMKSAIVGVQLLVILVSSVGCIDYGLKWGQKCKIPGSNDFLRPTEECEMSKGLYCQTYQQGNLCGCMIKSSLSWDERAEECRRKPGHHCPFMNTTLNPRAYDDLPYNHKCHSNSECKLVEPIPEIEATEQKRTKKKSEREQFAVCRCKPGYKESRDGLVCHSVNMSSKITITNGLLVTLLFLVVT